MKSLGKGLTPSPPHPTLRACMDKIFSTDEKFAYGLAASDVDSGSLHIFISIFGAKQGPNLPIIGEYTAWYKIHCQ